MGSDKWPALLASLSVGCMLWCAGKHCIVVPSCMSHEGTKVQNPRRKSMQTNCNTILTYTCAYKFTARVKSRA